MRTQRDQERLEQAVEANSTPIYATSYHDVREEYVSKYGQRAWIGEYIKGAGLRNPSIARARDDKPYLAARRSLERFEKGQNKSSALASPTVAERAGKQLPPIARAPIGGQIRIVVKGTQQSGYKRGGGIRSKTVDVTFKGSDAVEFVNNPTYEAIWDEYSVEPDQFDDGEYELTINSVNGY